MRLDTFLVEQKILDSRTKAKQAIERGEIFINDKPCNKPAFNVCELDKIEYVYSEKFVSLGGYKLNKALKDFSLDVSDFICVDIGASTGGFTDCLLKRKAKKVFAVDLNDELLHRTLKENPNVVSVIKNVKYLTQNDFNAKIDLIVADLSFISISIALPIISSLIEDGKEAIILIKPQFEVGTKTKFKNGVIRDKKIHIDACRKVYDCAIKHNLTPTAFTIAPIVDGKNVEFLLRLTKNGKDLLMFNEFIF